MKHWLFIVALALTFNVSAQREKAKEYFDRGYSLNGQGNYRGAIETLLQAVALDSTGDCGTGIGGNAQGEIGYAYLRSGDTINAYKYLDKSIVLNPSNPLPRQNKAVLLSMQKKYDDAVKTLDELIQLRPEFIDAYVQRGFFYNTQNKKQLAIDDFKKALELNKKSNALPSNLVKTLNDMINSQK